MSVSNSEREEAIAYLKMLLPEGSTVHTLLRHRAKSGKSSVFGMYVVHPERREIIDISLSVAMVLGKRYDRINGGVINRGIGMDLGNHLVYSLSAVLERKLTHQAL